MNNRDLYKQAFSALHASGNISLEVEMERKRGFVPTRRLAVACACLVLMLSLGLCAYAGGIVNVISGWANNYLQMSARDENGEAYSEAVLFTDSLSEPVELRDGRMYFIVNDERIDISDHISAKEAFIYEYEDEEGLAHVFLVGLLDPDDISHYGYAEYIRDADGNWVGGYSARINIEADGSTAAQWLELFKAEHTIPF